MHEVCDPFAFKNLGQNGACGDIRTERESGLLTDLCAQVVAALLEFLLFDRLCAVLSQRPFGLRGPSSSERPRDRGECLWVQSFVDKKLLEVVESHVLE